MFDSLFGTNYRENYFKSNPPDANGEYSCKICGKKMKKGDSDLTIDHIIPQKYDGSNAVTNLQVLCRSCNSKKSVEISAMAIIQSGEALIREIKNKFS